MYGTVTGWVAYAAARGQAISNDADATAALVRASDYIYGRYVIRFSSEYDGTEQVVSDCAYIAAAYEMTTPGFWSKVFTPSQVKVLTEAKGIKWTPVVSNMRGADDMIPVSTDIEARLVPLTRWGMPAVAVV